VRAPLAAGPGGTSPDAVATLYAALRRALADGAGPSLAMLPSPDQLPATLSRVTQPLDDVDVVITTSGSTDGRGHLVGLSLEALLASARATLDRLRGPGQWLTSLPVHHVAGFQVVLRSAVAGIAPTVHPRGRPLAESVAAMLTDVPRYLSLVPTQLVRALETDAGALAAFSGILVGGAALPPAVAARARDLGLRVVATYGMTETSGGCVYDGVPLDSVRVRLVDDVVQLAGPVLATRYLDTSAQPFVHEDGVRWLLTADLGTLDGGRLHVLGRADDVVISGGVNVHPRAVEDALVAALGGQWVVVGVDDPLWGQVVTAVGERAVSLAAVREATAHLAPAERPRATVGLPELPLGTSGKVDRRTVAALAAAELAAGRGERSG